MHDMPPHGQAPQATTPPAGGNGTPHHNGSPLEQLETWFDEMLGKKAPQLPENIRNAFVQYGPYVLVVFMIIGIPALLLALGLGAILSPLAILGGARGVSSFGFGFVHGLIGLAALVLQAIALPGLFAKTKAGWRWTYYSSLVSVVGSVLSFSLVGLLGNAIGLYVLFQIKSHYK